MRTRTPSQQWFDLDKDHGVLELHEHLTGGVGLELHMAHTPRGWLAWWVREDGAWLGMARMGRA